MLDAALADMGLERLPKVAVEPPAKREFGDVTCNAAMILSKAAGRKPRELAEELAARFRAAQHVESVEVAGPGFINLRFSPEFWRAVAADVLRAGDDFGQAKIGGGKRVNLEFVSANPTGPLHVGHGRGAAVGDSLARLMRFAGYDVATEYYINDAGVQMQILARSVWTRLQEKLGREVPVPEELYRGDYIAEVAAELLAARPEVADLAETEALAVCGDFAKTAMLAAIEKDLADFGVTFDRWYSEKALVDAGGVAAGMDTLAASGHLFEQDGALWFRTSELGDDKDRVLRKSSGELTYFASDVAYHADKLSRGFETLIDVWGADHHGYIPRVRAAIQALGRDPESFEVLLVQLVKLFRSGEPVRMSKRAGDFITLAEVVEETGVDAARFMLLSRKSDSQLDFDLDVVKAQTMDNPVYYVQYAHARVRSMLRKAAAETDLQTEGLADAALGTLDTPEDLDLLKELDRFEDVVESAARNRAPHAVSYYLRELAGELHRYYGVHHVLGAADRATAQARLALLAAVAQVVRTGLHLLGVSAPDKM